jgi:hypothetical protein
MYYLVVIGQPRDNKGRFKKSRFVVSGPYAGKFMPLPFDYLADYGNRKEKIYISKIKDIHLFIESISKDEFVYGYI